MKVARLVTALQVGALALVAFQAPAGQAWDRTLQDGSQVSIDPNTGRATVSTSRGAQTMLWDGVHKLQNGRTIIVRDGVVVPDVPMANARRAVPTPLAGGQASPCTVLQRTSCGLGNECAQTEGCRLAKQLVQFESEEPPGSLSTTSAQCREALGQGDTFKPCRATPVARVTSACTELAEKVCGSSEQCTASDACRAARQLLRMEHAERLTAANPDLPTTSTRQCTAAATDAFFAACAAATASGSAATPVKSASEPSQSPSPSNR
jgi:hypothetical protein